MTGFNIHNHQQAHFITFAVVDWIDVFTRPAHKKIIVDSLKFCQKNKGLRIHGWCLMTNHLHLLVSAQEDANLSDILRDFKKYTAFSILKDLKSNPKESRKEWMLWMFKKAGSQNSNNKKYQFWRQDNRPMEVTSNKFFTQKMKYIHYNPVKEGFCKRPQDYPYSSAQWYIDKTGLIEIEEILI
ncbi:MAG: transposase [Gracilimonas sp.]|uniref:REP-associated tyrosine transposase n=1 Tax=Gracilimonas sp. TaxID=1974203 RepID=UPI001997C0F4|nr:transposase [Gracilimonas sp.]MBD3615003.1 transposase [Gracilimonas sp.]